jgi:hypothetical protein
VANGGSGNDVIEADGRERRRVGSGDRIRAGSGNDQVEPGPGRDVVELGRGSDRVDAADPGPDSYHGGPEMDRISYERRTRGISALG